MAAAKRQRFRAQASTRVLSLFILGLGSRQFESSTKSCHPLFKLHLLVARVNSLKRPRKLLRLLGPIFLLELKKGREFVLSLSFGRKAQALKTTTHFEWPEAKVRGK